MPAVMCERIIRLGIITILLQLSNCNLVAYISNGPIELSGSQCPRVIFTCNALEINSPTISWFAGDTVLATYPYAALDVFPLEVRTDPTINATAEILNATFTSGFNYINFTLSVNLTELVSFRGQNITCGTALMKSNTIENNFEILNDLNIEIQLIYSNKTLKTIIAKWNDMFPNCGIVINYNSALRNDENQLLNENEIETNSCFNNSCTHSIDVMNISTSYFLQITATSIYDMYSSTSRIEGSSTFYINSSLKQENCMIIFSCSSLMKKGCLLRYRINELWQAPIDVNQEMMQPLNLTSLQSYMLEINTTYNNTGILVITDTGSLPQATNFKAVNDTTLIFFIFGIVLLFSGYVIIMIAQCLKKIRSKILCKYSLMLSIMSLLLLIVALSLWIAFGVISQGTCQMKGTVSHNLLIAALVFFILLTCLSAMILGGFILSIGVNLDMLIYQKFSFNLIETNAEPKKESKQCVQCNSITENDQFCANCNKRICNSCSKEDQKVLTGYYLDLRVACKKCYDKYFKENEKLCKTQVRDVSESMRRTTPHYCEYCNQQRKIRTSKNTGQITENYIEADKQTLEYGKCGQCASVLCNDDKFCYNKKQDSSEGHVVCMLCFILKKRKEQHIKKEFS